MGLFGKKKGKPLAGEADATPKKSTGKRQSSSRKSKSGRKSKQQPVEQPPTMELVPEYVKSLATAADAASEEAASALRALFALSEHNNNASTSSNREELVHAAEGQVVPTLLDFLRRSERNSSEQYLALLVLNNVSIPAENKKMIAVDCGGAHILSRLLCEDPSCHLMAIILVNLTFADAELRRDLVSPASPTQLVDALAYALIVATASPEIMETLPLPTNSQFNPRDLLAATMTKLKKSDSISAKRLYEYAKNNKVTVGIVAGAIASPAMLPAVGFTAAGVAGGSIAAGAQSIMYGAYTTGVFSVLQSAGTGAMAATSAVMAGGGIVGGVVGRIVDAATGGNATFTKFEESGQKADQNSDEK
mmetsp:Transcript_3767/g.5782  ORF Transcript_3767/g.5782 Transcript_3767/m.5782 type:complete len:363 (-) Transcript_3767:87-1175(-)